MCELCELKAKADKKREAYSFRIMQMQVDAQEGRTEQAREAKQLALKAFEECLDIVEQHALEVAKGGPDRHSDLPLSIADILSNSGGSSGLN
jgi:hypothetical protein